MAIKLYSTIYTQTSLQHLIQQIVRARRSEREQVSWSANRIVQVKHLLSPSCRVNSKATLRLPMTSLLPLLPNVLHAPIRDSRYHTSKSDAIVIQSDQSRKQGDNVEDCHVKLHGMIVAAAKTVIPGETSQSTMERVKSL